MNIEINLDNYLSEEEKKEIVYNCFRNRVSEKLTYDAERILNNMAHHQAEKIVNELLTEGQKNFIKEKTDKILSNFSENTVFYKSWYSREPHSIAYTIINDTVNQKRQEIIDRVVSLIENYDFNSRLDIDCVDILKDAIIKKLEKKESDY